VVNIQEATPIVRVHSAYEATKVQDGKGFEPEKESSTNLALESSMGQFVTT
jgi:hypothetical protein